MPRVLQGEQAVYGAQIRAPFLGPFRVIRKKTNCQTYVLDVAPYRFGTAWHVSHLVLAQPQEAGSADDTALLPGAILARNIDLDGQTRYLVRWRPGMSHPTWEEVRTLKETDQGKELLAGFQKRYPGSEPAARNDPELDAHPEWLDHVM